MSHLPQLHEAIAAATKTLQSLVDLDAQIGKAADLIDQCLCAGDKLLVCGNGGSVCSAGRCAHLPDYFRKIEEFGLRTGGSESAQDENDRLSRARWWIDGWHC